MNTSPELNEVINNWLYIVVGGIETRFVGTRNDSSQKPVLWLVPKLYQEVQASKSYYADGHLLSTCQVTKGIEEIESKRKEVVTGILPARNAEMCTTAGAGWCFPWKNPLRDTFCDLQRVFPMETQKVFLKEKSKKHIMCFFQVSHR